MRAKCEISLLKYHNFAYNLCYLAKAKKSRKCWCAAVKLHTTTAATTVWFSTVNCTIKVVSHDGNCQKQNKVIEKLGLQNSLK